MARSNTETRYRVLFAGKRDRRLAGPGAAVVAKLAIARQSSDFPSHLNETLKLGGAATRGPELPAHSYPCIMRLKRG
jgi:hypothetical protein